MQSPVGMYQEDAAYVIANQFPYTPQVLTLGPTEQRVFTFDFSSDLAPGEFLVGVANVSVENTAGSDTTPMDVVNGLPSYNVTQTQVLVPINATEGLLDNDYYLLCTCATSNPQKVLDRFCLLQIRS